VNLAQLLNGLALGALLMILSSGLAMIYGLRGVMNFSHGALYMLGAYLAYAVTNSGMSFWLALVLAPLGLAIVGAGLELGFFRQLQERSHIEVGLITFGIALVLDRVIVLIWGDDTHPVSAPDAVNGTANVFGTDYPTYRLLIIGIALAMAAALVIWLRRSRTGLHIRAASHDTETSSILGINVDRVSLVVVCLGAALAGLAGTLAAPYFSVQPGMGQAILITVLIVVVVGGIGSIGGAMVAGLLLGLIQIMGNVWVPSVSSLVPYALLIVVLLWRPTGLAGKRLA
jgi:branched-chain amino acid transport system permease protein